MSGTDIERCCSSVEFAGCCTRRDEAEDDAVKGGVVESLDVFDLGRPALSEFDLRENLDMRSDAISSAPLRPTPSFWSGL